MLDYSCTVMLIEFIECPYCWDMEAGCSCRDTNRHWVIVEGYCSSQVAGVIIRDMHGVNNLPSRIFSSIGIKR